MKRIIAAAALAGGLVVAASGTAAADSGGGKAKGDGIASGNVVNVIPVNLQLNACKTVIPIDLLNFGGGDACVVEDSRGK